MRKGEKLKTRYSADFKMSEIFLLGSFKWIFLGFSCHILNIVILCENFKVHKISLLGCFKFLPSAVITCHILDIVNLCPAEEFNLTSDPIGRVIAFLALGWTLGFSEEKCNIAKMPFYQNVMHFRPMQMQSSDARARCVL